MLRIAVLLIFALLLSGCNRVTPVTEPIIETTIVTEPTETTIPETEETEPPTTEPAIETTIVTEPPTEETIPETEVTEHIEIDPKELEYLSIAIYCEAGSDRCCDDCRRRVANVILNRIVDDRFPDTMLGVLRQEAQYGTFGWTGVVWPDMSYRESEKKAVERARRIAEEVLSGQHSELYGQNYIWQAEFVQGYDWIYCCGIYYGKG